MSNFEEVYYLNVRGVIHVCNDIYKCTYII
jgi:hypothetical protein